MSAVKNALQTCFDEVKEHLHCFVTLVKSADEGQRYLCLVGSIDEFPAQFKIYLVMKTEKGYKRKQEWPLRQLKASNYISKDSRDFDLQWDRLYHWSCLSLNEKEVFFELLHQICVPLTRPPKFLNYLGMQALDEPLDMSLKSRKRPHAQETVPKKKRASVINFVVTTGNSPDEPPTLHPEESTSPPPEVHKNTHILNDLLTRNRNGASNGLKVDDEKEPPQRIIINHDVDGGLEEHFRRSLCKEFYTEVDTEGVDAHFSRSLGSAKWNEIQRAAGFQTSKPSGSKATVPSTVTAKPKSAKQKT